MRDDFSLRVKDILSKRVGLYCSNPNCRVLTIGPNSNVQKATSIGVAAHITAASQGGARFNPLLTSTDRSSIENGIWLCQSCAKIIDNDSYKYSIELITKWKAEAEKVTELELTQNKRVHISNKIDQIFKLMPDLINEFSDDIKKNPLLREFILLEKRWVYGFGDKNILVYYYDDHEYLDAKIRLLENNDLVKDITYNNTSRYVLTEELVELLKIL